MSRIRQLLLVAHTHHDVGYTNSPRIIDRQHERIVSEVIALCEANAGDEPDRFRWTFEVARPVLRFLAHADPADVERLRAQVSAENISVTGGYLNMTQLPSAWEFDEAYDALGLLRDAGIPVRTEQHGDVNGLAWGAVPAMRRAGIERLVTALNPDHGRAPFAQPSAFWWEGPGGERVFTLLSTHYGFGEEWGIVDGDTELAERCISAFVSELGERGDYPFDAAVVHAGNDNRWPTAAHLAIVRHWNATHPDVPMRTATIDEALDVLQSHPAAAALPVHRGEWSDWWAHGHGSTAREVAVYREARAFARAAQSAHALSVLADVGEPALATVLGYRRGPAILRSEDELLADLAHVDEQLLLFDEHTWGSWETYSKPHSNLSHSHWNAKAGFAYDAFDNARDLAIEGLFRLAAGGGGGDADAAERKADGILVFNPSERDRIEPVAAEIDGARRARVVATVPAFGLTVVDVPDAAAESSTGRVIETSRYRAEVDPSRGGIVSLVERETGRELVDGGHALAAIVRETVPASSTHPMVTRSPKDFHPEDPGPDFERSVVAGDAEPEILETDAAVQISWQTAEPGILASRATLVLYRDGEQIDVDVHVAKPESFEPESVFVAFPFAAASPEFLLETAGAVYAAGAEQLPDTSADWYSIQHSIGVNASVGGILWGSFDAPLVQIGGFHTGAWARTLDAPVGHVNSWLMNNLHFTNFQARQEVTRTFRYRFTPRARPVSRREVRLFGRDIAEPLQARQYTGPFTSAREGAIRVEPADDVVCELRPVGTETVRARLRNITGREVTVRVNGAHVESEGGEGVAIPAFGTADVVLRRSGG